MLTRTVEVGGLRNALFNFFAYKKHLYVLHIKVF